MTYAAYRGTSALDGARHFECAILVPSGPLKLAAWSLDQTTRSLLVLVLVTVICFQPISAFLADQRL